MSPSWPASSFILSAADLREALLQVPEENKTSRRNILFLPARASWTGAAPLCAPVIFSRCIFFIIIIEARQEKKTRLASSGVKDGVAVRPGRPCRWRAAIGADDPAPLVGRSRAGLYTTIPRPLPPPPGHLSNLGPRSAPFLVFAFALFPQHGRPPPSLHAYGSAALFTPGTFSSRTATASSRVWNRGKKVIVSIKGVRVYVRVRVLACVPAGVWRFHRSPSGWCTGKESPSLVTSNSSAPGVARFRLGRCHALPRPSVCPHRGSAPGCCNRCGLAPVQSYGQTFLVQLPKKQ